MPAGSFAVVAFAVAGVDAFAVAAVVVAVVVVVVAAVVVVDSGCQLQSQKLFPPRLILENEDFWHSFQFCFFSLQLKGSVVV